ncbi:hypothetical protein [Actinoalloteichus spitiensis]|uniref:hypothetical protein n=1 Tax=Actinoalloteichus spitiensis TaxID=252394 RepID=UPI000370FDB3|nr:hypothetical protein [Actinoalloteichus spitiensis]
MWSNPLSIMTLLGFVGVVGGGWTMWSTRRSPRPRRPSTRQVVRARASQVRLRAERYSVQAILDRCQGGRPVGAAPPRRGRERAVGPVGLAGWPPLLAGVPDTAGPLATELGRVRVELGARPVARARRLAGPVGSPRRAG